MLRFENYRPQSEWGKRIYAEGRDEGKAEGKAEGEAGALIVLLEARGLPMSPAQRSRIEHCRDRHQLRAWLGRAATAVGIEDILGERVTPSARCP